MPYVVTSLYKGNKVWLDNFGGWVVGKGDGKVPERAARFEQQGVARLHKDRSSPPPIRKLASVQEIAPW